MAGADPRLKSKTWDDSKITAHHGIIPTMHKGSKAGLSEKERNIYDLIVRAYLAQFYPVHEYMSTTVGVEVEGKPSLRPARLSRATAGATSTRKPTSRTRRKTRTTAGTKAFRLCRRAMA